MSKPIATADPRTRLRFATREDVPLVLELIRGLAEYEKLAHEVVTDVAELERALFGERCVAEVVIAEYEEQAAGFALFFHNFSTFRGRGIGETLLSFLAALAVERGCGRLEWSVLDWNEPAIRFYERLGAEAMNEWTVFRVTGDALPALAARFASTPGP